MATLNTSSEGAAINKSYQSIVNATAPSGAAGSSPTYGQWAVYSVQAPLASAFQQDSGKDSVLKVFRTGEGELVDLIDEFSEGKIQFAFVKVKDPNTKLAKNVLIAWCGEGVPERTKGYFTSHLAAVSKLLHGYHVQITARTDHDLSPESIIRKVADASGSKYSGDTAPASSSSSGPPPPVASKPVFTSSSIGGGGKGFNPLGSRAARAAPQGNVDEDGWGEDAPQVTRSQLEKVAPAYKPTKVNMAELQSQKEPSRFNAPASEDRPDVVKGAYQPVGKVDIAAIRRQAQESGNAKDDRPTPVKGSYEPVGKVDIAAIRSRAQPPPSAASPSQPSTISPSRTGTSSEQDQSERLTSLPKPKPANKFGSGASSFGGTKAPLPGGFDQPSPAKAPVGTASKTFADQGGKTPAQIWAEKKARERGSSIDASDPSKQPASPMAKQPSGSTSGAWESGYTGKKWGPVQIPKAGQAPVGEVVKHDTTSDDTQPQSQPADATSPTTNVGSIRDRFKDVPPMGGATEDAAAAPPPMNLSSKPNAGLSIPPPPAQPPRTPSPDADLEHEDQAPSSPIRIAQPVGRGAASDPPFSPPEERSPPPALPHQSISAAAATHDNEPEEEEEEEAPPAGLSRVDTARAAGTTAAASTFSPKEVASAPPPSAGAGAASSAGKTAIAQYDYEKAEDNELELKEGETVTEIDMVDEDWWMGRNASGETGLFPANYVELVEGGGEGAGAGAGAGAAVQHEEEEEAPAAAAQGPTATAEYDYEAAEENELSFPEGAKILNIEKPDEDWWAGEYDGKVGLFPANYVTLD